jgi:hypothetical protein
MDGRSLAPEPVLPLSKAEQSGEGSKGREKRRVMA